MLPFAEQWRSPFCPRTGAAREQVTDPAWRDGIDLRSNEMDYGSDQVALGSLKWLSHINILQWLTGSHHRGWAQPVEDGRDALLKLSAAFSDRLLQGLELSLRAC